MGKVTIPQSALSRSQLPLHKGAFRRVRRGEQCSPVELCVDVWLSGASRTPPPTSCM